MQSLDFLRSRTFNRTPWQSALSPLERLMQPHTVLQFPTFVSADHYENNLIVSDTHHNRLLIIDRQGRILDCIGTGKYNKSAGSAAIEGDAHTAVERGGLVHLGGVTFFDADLARPHGSCIVDDDISFEGLVFFADTDTDSIKYFDLRTRTVSHVFDVQVGSDAGAKQISYRAKQYEALKKRFIYANSRMSSTMHIDELIAAKADIEFEMERLELAAAPIPLLCDRSNGSFIRRPMDLFFVREGDSSLTMYIVDETYQNLWRVRHFYNHHIDAHRAAVAKGSTLPRAKQPSKTLRAEAVPLKEIHAMSGFTKFRDQYLSAVLNNDSDPA